MSIKAVTWAFEQKLNDSVAKLVLIGIADRYNTEFGYAYPAIKWLAQVADCSERTVQRKIQFLQEIGMVSVLQTHSKDPKTRGTNKYNLPQLGGVTPISHPNYRTIFNYNNIIKMFDLFWEASPKKVGKQHALKAWKKAVKDTEPGVLISGMKAYADLVKRKGIEPQYIKHPQTWLNGGCWDDVEDAPVESRENFGVSQRWMPKTEEEFKAKFDAMPDWYRKNRPDVISVAIEAGWLDG